MLPISIEENPSFWQEQIRAIEQALTLTELLSAAWQFACKLTIWLVERVLAERAQRPSIWEACPQCGERLESKGLKARQLRTGFGVIRWKRPVYAPYVVWLSDGATGLWGLFDTWFASYAH